MKEQTKHKNISKGNFITLITVIKKIDDGHKVLIRNVFNVLLVCRFSLIGKALFLAKLLWN